MLAVVAHGRLVRMSRVVVAVVLALVRNVVVSSRRNVTALTVLFTGRKFGVHHRSVGTGSTGIHQKRAHLGTVLVLQLVIVVTVVVVDHVDHLLRHLFT